MIDVFPDDTTSLLTGMGIVTRARALAKHPPKQLADAKILVGGFLATNVDLQDDLLARFPLLVALILGATGIMLAIAFRSVLIPLKAILLNTLSVAGTFGLLVLVFQKGFGIRVLGPRGCHRRHLRGGAGARLRRRLRPEHGLRGVPAEPDQGSVRSHRTE